MKILNNEKIREDIKIFFPNIKQKQTKKLKNIIKEISLKKPNIKIDTNVKKSILNKLLNRFGKKNKKRSLFYRYHQYATVFTSLFFCLVIWYWVFDMIRDWQSSLISTVQTKTTEESIQPMIPQTNEIKWIIDIEPNKKIITEKQQEKRNNKTIPKVTTKKESNIRLSKKTPQTESTEEQTSNNQLIEIINNYTSESEVYDEAYIEDTNMMIFDSQIVEESASSESIESVEIMDTDSEAIGTYSVPEPVIYENINIKIFSWENLIWNLSKQIEKTQKEEFLKEFNTYKVAQKYSIIKYPEDKEKLKQINESFIIKLEKYFTFTKEEKTSLENTTKISVSF